MKKRNESSSASAKPGRVTTVGIGNSALDFIVKQAYRRHTRGRVARAAVASCLGV